MPLPASLFAQTNQSAEVVRQRRPQTIQNRLQRRVRKSPKNPEVAWVYDSRPRDPQHYGENVPGRLRAPVTVRGEEEISSKPASETRSVPCSKRRSVYDSTRRGRGKYTKFRRTQSLGARKYTIAKENASVPQTRRNGRGSEFPCGERSGLTCDSCWRLLPRALVPG